MKMKYDYQHSLFVNKKNGKVVSIKDAFVLNNKVFIQYKNAGNSGRRTTLSQDRFLKNYREINEK